VSGTVSVPGNGSFLDGISKPGYVGIDILRGADDQLKALIDVCHVYGIAVLFDVVYNHAGGGFDENSPLWFTDRLLYGDPNDSLYFTDQGSAGRRNRSDCW